MDIDSVTSERDIHLSTCSNNPITAPATLTPRLRLNRLNGRINV